ncbi:eCIS core domain-containing protein [Kribbella kalugense]|uniref:L,D-transpeptidase-like protein n=1 Tax=Kribbella kalugense TaxID=2512221 RepID=A0A4R7ZVE6_9ACTN|nr:DUF4157 domain-containing protein [Kribbella kalugense]TDW22069.1 L,D-transpeptidase-like protein [Kribbella kalugense]
MARGEAGEREADALAGAALMGRPVRAGSRELGESEGVRAPASVKRALGRRGAELPSSVRAGMEQRFGHDFANVRIHQDDAAARDVEAPAFTVGSDIVFGRGAYPPTSPAGRHMLAHELAHVVQGTPGVVRRYRSPKAFNFGVEDDAVLKEGSFDPNADKATKPWIESVKVAFASKAVDGDGFEYWRGSASATYFNSPAKGADFTFPVAGGVIGRTTDRGNFTVFRIEGAGYNSGAYSGTPGVDFDPAQREGPNNRYTKVDARGDRLSNMSFAVFYNQGESLHAGPVDAGSHGCVHVDWNNLNTIKRLNYHSVIGLTKVAVTYPKAP